VVSFQLQFVFSALICVICGHVFFPAARGVQNAGRVVVSFQFQVPSFQLPEVSFQLPVGSFQFQVPSFQLPVVSD
jgi:hypothetical protein